MQDTKPTLAIIGAGRVGSALAQGLAQKGYLVEVVYSRTAATADWLADKVRARVVTTVGQAASAAQLSLLTVPDDQLVTLCRELVSECGATLSRRSIVHTSGAWDVSILEAARLNGASIGGFHPMLPIMNRELPAAFAGKQEDTPITFGIEAQDESLRRWLSEMVAALNGRLLWLRPGQDRARYHAAGVIASNYAVTLFAEAVSLLQKVGDVPLDELSARQTLLGLVENTVRNISTGGATAALTGPISRGDTGTVSHHLDTLNRTDPELAELYRLLGRRTLRIAAERGLSPDLLAALTETLNEGHARQQGDKS